MSHPNANIDFAMRSRSETNPLSAAWHWFCFGWTTLLGAFLVFQVQPIISKCVLPWFGGTPAVWTTCMLFFQCVLFLGYLYAHLLKTLFTPRWQALIHLSLLCVAAFTLPIQPNSNWKPTGETLPVWHLIKLLGVHVGLPYFVLSSTGPLMQAWFSLRQPSNQVYRLYALSNVGSLLALLTYPFLIEPFLSVQTQSLSWSLGFCGFVLFQGLIAVGMYHQKDLDIDAAANVSENSKPSIQQESASSNSRNARQVVRQQVVRWQDRLAWVALPAFASTMLLVVTDHVSQDVAVIPFLWVLPLSLYLLSFIISFDSPRWYLPKPIAALTLISIGVIYCKGLVPAEAKLVTEATAYMFALFGICLLCHGEVARIKPPSQYLTAYYVALSGGGAVGGLLIAVVCPSLFTSHFELPLSMAVTLLISTSVFFASRNWTKANYNWALAKKFTIAAAVFVLIPVLSNLFLSNPNTIASQRNFFGVLRVEKFPRGTRLVHGNTIHGMQLSGHESLTATTYYGKQSGVSLAWKTLQEQQPEMDICVVGLGCGVLSTYGREADRLELIEINPAMIEIANSHFSFLKQCKSDWKTSLGDGRILLEQHSAEKLDLLVLDAFSSDAIPAHLLTVESFAVYKRTLKESGVLAIHLSNNHLDLVPLTHNLANVSGLESRIIRAPGDDETLTMHSTWMIIAAESNDIWKADRLQTAERPTEQELADAPLWTDQEHNLASVLKLW